jgi:hypothetical protein
MDGALSTRSWNWSLHSVAIALVGVLQVLRTIALGQQVEVANTPPAGGWTWTTPNGVSAELGETASSEG